MAGPDINIANTILKTLLISEQLEIYLKSVKHNLHEKKLYNIIGCTDLLLNIFELFGFRYCGTGFGYCWTGSHFTWTKKNFSMMNKSCSSVLGTLQLFRSYKSLKITNVPQ